MATLVMNKRKLQNLAQVFEEENRTDSVQELHACFNFITTVPVGLERKLSSLQVLSLGCNCLTEIPPVGAMVQLKELHLPNNHITVIERLQTLAQLEVLNLRCNQISILSNLVSNTFLTRLTVSGNSLKDIDFNTLPAALPLLKFLGLYANQLQDISQVLRLISLAPSLCEVFVGCNPFCANQQLSSTSFLLSRHPHIDVFSSTLVLTKQESRADDGALCTDGERTLRHLQITRAIARSAPHLTKIDGEKIFLEKV